MAQDRIYKLILETSFHLKCNTHNEKVIKYIVDTVQERIKYESQQPKNLSQCGTCYGQGIDSHTGIVCPICKGTKFIQKD